MGGRGARHPGILVTELEISAGAQAMGVASRAGQTLGRQLGTGKVPALLRREFCWHPLPKGDVPVAARLLRNDRGTAAALKLYLVLHRLASKPSDRQLDNVARVLRLDRADEAAVAEAAGRAPRDVVITHAHAIGKQWSWPHIVTFTPELALAWLGEIPRTRRGNEDTYETRRKVLRSVDALEKARLIERLDDSRALIKIRMRDELGRAGPYVHPRLAREASFPVPDELFTNGWHAVLDGAQIVVLLVALERSHPGPKPDAAGDLRAGEFFVTKDGAVARVGLTHKRFREAAAALENHGLLTRRRAAIEDRGARLAEATAKRREVWRLVDDSLAATPSAFHVAPARLRRRAHNAEVRAASRTGKSDDRGE